ncbi:MAG: DUF6174 domain-containing protein [Gracilimonas sp.]|uniref:DUF6174 domain-containing protein n=1 Tax=Gracilimonas sp. TaxID=1974203 RepID=UPI0037534D81|nr:DUF6174 domain-containing protein [Gracilimonas sp.]
MRILLTMISFSLLLTSCEVFNSSNNNGDVELTEAIEKWNSNNSKNYTFENSRTCECMPPYNYTVEVINGEIKDVHFEMQEHINYERKEMILITTRTIDELFDLLEKYEETADHFEVEFHEELGYLTEINIDPSREIADEEIILEISNYSLLNS